MRSLLLVSAATLSGVSAIRLRDAPLTDNCKNAVSDFLFGLGGREDQWQGFRNAAQDACGDDQWVRIVEALQAYYDDNGPDWFMHEFGLNNA